MSFQQGLSGLNVSSKALDVISNNISNASTIGFKGGAAQFADVYAASLGVGGGSQVGIGASLPSVRQQFTQGTISNSSNSLDLAVNGSGFFRIQKTPTDSTITYTRNGQFELDDQGYIVNSMGNNLTGYPITNGVTDRAVLVPVQLDTTGAAPAATGSASVDAGIQTQINLDDRLTKSLSSASPNTLAAWSSNTSFPPNNVNTYNYSTSLSIYDQKGNSHALSTYYTRVANSSGSAPDKNLWEVHYVLDDKDITSAVSGGTASGTGTPTLEFNSQGQVVTSGFSSSTGRLIDSQFKISATGLATVSSSFSGLFSSDIPVDYAGSTVYGSTSTVMKQVQDGYPYGTLSSVTVSSTGVLQGNYSNGQTKDIAQLVLVDFIAPNGLQNVGNNQWVETSASGQPLVGDPGSGSRGVVQASAVEEANVDLTQELVNLITQQRNYQASAQTIKTQDQVMQTLVNLR